MAEDSNRTSIQQWWVQKHCLLYNTTNTASWYGRILQLCDPDSPHYQPMFQKVMGVLPGTEDSVLQLLPGGAFLMHAKSTWVAVYASARLDSINWMLPAGAYDVSADVDVVYAAPAVAAPAVAAPQAPEAPEPIDVEILPIYEQTQELEGLACKKEDLEKREVGWAATHTEAVVEREKEFGSSVMEDMVIVCYASELGRKNKKDPNDNWDESQPIAKGDRTYHGGALVWSPNAPDDEWFQYDWDLPKGSVKTFKGEIVAGKVRPELCLPLRQLNKLFNRALNQEGNGNKSLYRFYLLFVCNSAKCVQITSTT